MAAVNRQPNRLGKTATLGAMVDWIGDPYQCGILSGVFDGAKAAGATFLCFVGESIPVEPEKTVRHRAFELIGPHNVDGLVVLASTLSHHIGAAGLTDYCKRHFSGLPLCSVGTELEGIPSITTNNGSGISSVVKHLITQHGHRRIAFVRGPLANEEAETRFLAYVNTLKEHDIAFDERLVAVGTFMAPSGQAAVRSFAQIPGTSLKDLDAIVSSNDGMAAGVLRALEEHGIAVPGTVAVTGFDDVEEASLTTPPLTTVRQSLSKMGRQAARGVLEWIQTGNMPTDDEVNTELVVRRSCGCSERELRARLSIVPEMNGSFESALLMRREHILDSLARAARGDLGIAGRDWQVKLLNAFIADLNSAESGALQFLVEEMTEKLLVRGTSVRACRDVVDCLRNQLIVTLRGNPVRREHAEGIFYSAHLAIGEVVSRGMMRERSKLGRWVRNISITCNMLSSVPTLNDLRRSIETQLPYLGLNNYYVVTYRDQNPSSAELFIAHDEAFDTSVAERSPFDARTLLPPALLPALDGRAFAVMPLALRDMRLGHMLLELKLEFSFSYDSVADAIANGLHTSRLSESRG